ncbi:MAG: glycoside hydrolase family 43 protein [Paludibacter sp.]|jgi:beta-xylosidase|nr:glycoside hydrolase family 43 protein [Paludibacter sp.]
MKSKITFLFAIFSIIFFSNTNAQQIAVKDTLQYKPVALADPFILLHEGKYYAYGTSSPDGICVYVSDNLLTWTKPENPLALHKKDVWGDSRFWAPEVYFINGLFYMYYSADEHICVATSASPLGPFVQDVKQPMFDEKGIDNSLFIDDDGRAYLFFVRFTDGNAIWVAELEKDYKTIKINTLRLCFAASGTWESDLGKVNEGAFCIKRNDIYYLTYSANDFRSQNYGVGYAVGKDIMGKWTKYEGNPILQKAGNLVGTGHHALFTDKDGQLRIVFHSHNSKQNVSPRLMHIGTLRFVEQEGKTIINIDKNYISPKIIETF